jgi:hypothetical protein
MVVVVVGGGGALVVGGDNNNSTCLLNKLHSDWQTCDGPVPGNRSTCSTVLKGLCGTTRAPHSEPVRVRGHRF